VKEQEIMTENRMPQVLVQDIGDTDLSYLLYEGDGPTLILMHATGFLPWLWHPIARKLSKEWRIVAPYFCDHRESDPEKGGLSWMRIAEDLAIFCTRLGIEKPGLVGHSMGATVLTLAHAAFGIDAEGIVLFEPIFLPQDFYRMTITVDQHPLASRSIKRRDTWRDREEALSYLRSRSLFKSWDDEMLSLYLEYGFREGDAGGLTLACSPRREASLFMGGNHFDPWPLLPEVSCPALVIEGSESENRAFIDLRKATSLIPGGKYILMEGAGHLIPMEQPQQVTRIIREFFSKS
jgi:pimeloyl-ACP methyl ester carboxylesterase